MSDTVLKAIPFQPGINKNTTEYNAEGGWVDCDKVRFRNGNAEKWGGWVKEKITAPRDAFSSAFSTDFSTSSASVTSQATVPGVARDIKTWVDLNGNKYVAVATNMGVFIVYNNILYDISPSDFVPGLVNTGYLTGYGGGTWDTPGLAGGGYDEPRAGAANSAPLQEWSLDNWGENLIACNNGGKIYQWVAANGVTSKLTAITNSPAQNTLAAVALPSRFLIAFGSIPTATGIFDPLTIRWADQESLTTWSEAFTNQAGEYRLPLGNYIVGVCQSRSAFLVFTDSAVFTMTFVGAPDIFDFNVVSTNAGLLAQHAATDVDGTVFWPGHNNFYMYNGFVNVLPTTVNQLVFDQYPSDLATSTNSSEVGRLNRSQKAQCFSGTNRQFSEWIFLYPDQTSDEPNRYVTYNYLDGICSIGSLDRTVWVDGTIFDTPIAVDAEGNLFSHEIGYDDDAVAMPSYVESAWFDIADGETLMFCDRVVPDIKIPENRSVQFTMQTKKYPTGPIITKGPFNITSSTQRIFARTRGRQMKVRFDSNGAGASFQLGKMRLGFQQDGSR